MDRTSHAKYYPEAPRHIALVDQYMWPVKDTNKYMAFNGISHPIYSCTGNINYTLPLEMYPPVNDVHPQIKMIRRMHLNQRGPNPVRYTPPTRQDYLDGNVPVNYGWRPRMPNNAFRHKNRVSDGSSSRGREMYHDSDMDETDYSGDARRQMYDHFDDTDQSRTEGFYSRGPYFTNQMGCGKMGSLNNETPGIHMMPGEMGPSRSGFIEATMVTEPGKLPDPSGYAAGCSACSGCPGR